MLIIQWQIECNHHDTEAGVRLRRNDFVPRLRQ